jgi:hypothetical protein
MQQVDWRGRIGLLIPRRDVYDAMRGELEKAMM